MSRADHTTGPDHSEPVRAAETDEATTPPAATVPPEPGRRA